MSRLILEKNESSAIRALLGELTSLYSSVEDKNFLKDVSVTAHELPRRVRVFLNDFKQLEPAPGVCIISGYTVDDQRIGPTPKHWKARSGVSPTLAEEMLFLLYSSLLGDAIGWATQQDGHLVHDVLPIKDDENEQISTGSQQTIWWHNEDAFHPYRGDYVALMCLRNPDHIPTTFASVDMLELDPEVKEILFEPRYIIKPDESHAEKNNGCKGGEACATAKFAYRHIEMMRKNPQKQPVLLGHPQSPYLRLDPYFMSPPDDDASMHALNTLIREIDSKLSEVVLQPGDYLFVDNYRSVHGRKAFKARYDGTDRWLKRMNITRDLRKSRDSRERSSSRIIF
jgi:Fe(II)/alpha-ketoglutarate-dependent arginine beta-hydroxylase